MKTPVWRDVYRQTFYTPLKPLYPQIKSHFVPTHFLLLLFRENEENLEFHILFSCLLTLTHINCGQREKYL